MQEAITITCLTDDTKTKPTVNLGTQPGNYKIMDLETGKYVISVYAVYDLYWLTFLNTHGWLSYPQSLTVVVDETIPNQPDAPLLAESTTSKTINNISYTRDNISTQIIGADGNPRTENHCINLSLQVPIDQGWSTDYTDNSDSGVGGYNVYYSITDIVNAPLTLIAKIINNTRRDSPATNITINGKIPLSEGKCFLRISAFDNIALLENSGLASSASNYSLPIVVDRTGPAAVVPQPHNFTTIEGKNYSSESNNSYVTWAVPSDYPKNSDDAFIGIGAKYYDVYINDVAKSIDQTTPSFTIPYIELPSGSYTLKIRPKDLLQNPGQESAPSTFYIDKTPPPAPETGSFAITNDPEAIKSKTTNSVTFQTRNNSCNISFAGVSEGADLWQSGLDSDPYYLYDTNGGETHLTGTSIHLENLHPGINSFTLKAKDRIGNWSDPVNLIIDVFIITLQPVTFPINPDQLCTLVDGKYFLNWYAPLDGGVTANIAYYKVIVQGINAPAPNDPSLFIGTSIPPATLQYSLDGVPRDVDRMAYVLAIDSNNSWNWSIGSTQFTLPAEETPVRPIDKDETWGPGVFVLDQSVSVKPGITLTIVDNTTVRVSEGKAIFIKIEEGGILKIGDNDTGSNITIEGTEHNTTTWKGIIIMSGYATIKGAAIHDAERGLAVLSGSTVTVIGSEFINCRVGIHAGTGLTITGTRFENCEWYGVKEDAIGLNNHPILTGCVFKNNGYLYYHDTLRIIDIGTLNGLPSNHDNILGN